MNLYIEYVNYLFERPIGINKPTDFDTAQVMHYYSGGPCEPIEPTGLGQKYYEIDVNVPDWMLAGVKRSMQDGRWEDEKPETVAAYMAYGEYDDCEWCKAIRYISCSEKPCKFYLSLIDWFISHGSLSVNQARAVLYPRYKKY